MASALLQFHNPLIYILLAAGAVKLVMAGYVDAGVILAVVLVNAWIGYLQEVKAERAIETLARSLVTESNVLRAGKTVRVPSTELVPGDVVLLAAGDKVPANLEAIVAVADGVMVARDDLGVETDLAEIPLLQKRIIAAANAQARPVITATQMLESMVDRERDRCGGQSARRGSRPTRGAVEGPRHHSSSRQPGDGVGAGPIPSRGTGVGCRRCWRRRGGTVDSLQVLRLSAA